MAAESHAPTAGEYIVHHLQHLSSGLQESLVDFSVVNIDSVVLSAILGAAACLVMWLAARGATAGVPGRFQGALEMLVDLVDGQAKAVIHDARSRRVVGPLALTVFIWIFLMNAMDLLPVDLLPWVWTEVYAAAGHDPHHAYLRVVPTADLSTTLGLSGSVLLVCIYYNLKIKGA
ncbi:MAG TPA: F0F1 ATP synthase subunit A, partial [Gammaproteobacteria bacterium]|nr:F0F1 ATP synthase subunit A [Gammaproteobacteria bacterium]MCH79203.1 F0F1 ATP synthase subunit A [Gammaproteobacteria bacterium]